jgi:Ca2+-binding EF-hand superfamily protein
MWSPPKGKFNNVIQGEALVHGADEIHNKRGSGMIILVQNGRHFYLDFLNLKVRNVQDRTLRVYLLKKKKAKGKKDADSLENRVKKKKAFMLDLDLGEDGALVGDKVVGVSHFQQPLGTALKGVGGVSPLDWVGVVFAKPSTEKPRTPSADVYAFANIGPPPEYDVEDEEKVSTQVAVEERRVLDMMMGQARGSLTLRDVKRKADAVFRHQEKDNRTDDLTYAEFCKGMKYLGIHLTEARSRKLFRTADLDKGGSIDCSEFEMAVHIDDKIKAKDSMTPLDAFDIFDENFRGGVDAIEFYKLMMALDVEISMEQSMSEFNTADGDHSGILDYDEFRTIWLRYCDVESELIKRNVAPTSEHRVKKAKKRAQMDLEALRKLVEKEEADEKATFDKAKNECIEERRTQRRAKSERASKRRGERTREANIARREKAKLEREKKSRASIRR